MITLYKGKYTQDDLEMLNFLINEMLSSLMQETTCANLKPKVNCKSCKCKTLCKDIWRLKRHVLELIDIPVENSVENVENQNH